MQAKFALYLVALAVLSALECFTLLGEERLPVLEGSSCKTYWECLSLWENSEMAACRVVGILLTRWHGVSRGGKCCFDTFLYHVLTKIMSSVKLESEILWSPYGAFDISSSSPCLDCLSQFLCASCGKAEIINLCCVVCSIWDLDAAYLCPTKDCQTVFSVLNWSVHLLRKEASVIYLLILLFFLLVSHKSLIFN